MATDTPPVSGDEGADPDTGGGSPVGTLLRACRVKAGYDLGELSRQLRIRQKFLEAIEDGRFADMPGHTYAIGFVRSYAEYFGLDPQEIVRRFRIEAGERGGTQALHFPAPVAERDTPKAAVILIGLILAGIAYGAWYFNSVHENAIVDLVSPVPERLRHLIDGDDGGADQASGSAAPAADAPVVVVPVPPRAAPAAPPPAPAAPPKVASQVESPASTASAPSAPPAPSSEAQSAPPVVVPSPAPAGPATALGPTPAAAAAAPALGGGRVVLRAKADSWVQIRDPATRSTLLARILKAGEVFSVPDTAGLLMTVGNAGGLDVVVDGQALPALGRDGAVRRNVPLDAEALRAAAGGN